jgi:hypothetical protein
VAAATAAAAAEEAADTNEEDTKTAPPFSFSFSIYRLQVTFLFVFTVFTKRFSIPADLRNLSFRAKRDDASATVTVKSFELHASGFRSERAMTTTFGELEFHELFLMQHQLPLRTGCSHSPLETRNPKQASLSLTNPQWGMHVI